MQHALNYSGTRFWPLKIKITRYSAFNLWFANKYCKSMKDSASKVSGSCVRWNHLFPLVSKHELGLKQ